MSEMVTALTGTGGISSSLLWGEAAAAAPLILIIFAFAFGFLILRRVLKGGSKGKLRV